MEPDSGLDKRGERGIISMKQRLREASGGGYGYKYTKGDGPMATYIMLVRWTQKGVENIKQSPNRLDEAKQAFQAMGAEMKEFYLVTGQYDMVVVAEAR